MTSQDLPTSQMQGNHDLHHEQQLAHPSEHGEQLDQTAGVVQDFTDEPEMDMPYDPQVGSLFSLTKATTRVA